MTDADAKYQPCPTADWTSKVGRIDPPEEFYVVQFKFRRVWWKFWKRQYRLDVKCKYKGSDQ